MAARIHELRAKLAHAKLALETVATKNLAAAKAGNRGFTDEERDEAAVAQALYNTAQEAVDDEQRNIEAGKREAGSPRVPKVGGVGLKYQALFGPPVKAGLTRSDFFGSIGTGVRHPAIEYAAASSMNEGVGSDGGFLVPEEFVAEAFDGAVEDEPILQRVTIEPMTSETKRVAGFATKDHSSAGPFGFSGGWVGEGATLTPERALIRSLRLAAKKLALLVQASNEVAADGQGFDGQLSSAMQTALGWLLADSVFNGTGSGQPQGILKQPSLVVVSKESGQAADSITYPNIVAMLSRLLPSSMKNAAFFASHTTRPYLMMLSVATGLGGTWVPLQLGADGVYRLIGIPLYFTEHLPVLGDQGDIVLIDPTQYVLGLRSAIAIDRSAHVGFGSDLMTYRGIVRADGQGKHDAAFTPKNGSTQSPFVTLQAR